MGSLNVNHTVNLSGDPNNLGTDNAGDERLDWFGGSYLSSIGAYADNNSPIAVTVNLSGEQWGVGRLQIDMDNQEITTITLNDTSTGDLDNDEGVGFDLIYLHATMSTNLVFTSASFDHLQMDGGSADTIELGLGFYQWISTESGTDTVSINGDNQGHGGVGRLDTGDDDDAVNVNGGYVDSVITGNGSDVVNISGADIEYLNTGGDDQVDDDEVTMGPGGNVGILRMWDGNNSLTMTGTNSDDSGIDFASMGSGNDTVSVGQHAYIQTLDVGSGVNDITISGNLQILKGYNGSNTVTIEDGSGAGIISLGADDSSYTNKIDVGDASYVQSITLGNSNDTVTVGVDTWVETIEVGRGTNAITIAAGGGSTSVRGANGSTTLNILAGGYIDSVNLYSNQAYVDNGGIGSTVNANGYASSIFFGRAVDTLNIGAEGIGFANMGRGNDIINISEASQADYSSLVSGAEDTDTVSFSTFTSGVKISLATSAYNQTDHGAFALIDIERLIGTSSADTLTGAKSTASELKGGTGADTYYITSSLTVVNETGGGGTDTVKSASISINLSYGTKFQGNVENATLEGASSLNLTGNSLGNTLTGNSGENVIDGKGGNDTLIGGAGKDDFQFTTNLNAGTNVDTITGFNVADDRIILENAVFTALPNGWLFGSAFQSNSTGTATTAAARIIYDNNSGELYYDKDGVGGAAGVQFADLDGNPALTKSDFFVI